MDETEALLAPAELEALEERRSAGRPLQGWEVDIWTPDEILNRIEAFGVADAVLPWDWPLRLLAARMRLPGEWELVVIAVTTAIIRHRPDLLAEMHYLRRGSAPAVQASLLEEAIDA